MSFQQSEEHIHMLKKRVPKQYLPPVHFPLSLQRLKEPVGLIEIPQSKE